MRKSEESGGELLITPPGGLRQHAELAAQMQFDRALLLVLVQIGLGAATVLTAKAVLPTTAHVATGAAILGLCWLVTLRSRRLLRPSARAAAVAAVPLGDPALS